VLCRDWTLVKLFAGGFLAAPLCCRSWGCDYCQPDRKQRIMRQAALGHPDTLITLTVNPARGFSPAERAEELVIAWRKFVRFYKKHYSTPKIPYFVVFEATRKGEPHMHILCRVAWISQQVLSNFMKEEIDAPIVDVRRCKNARSAARYVAKYVGKAPGKFGSCKRYWQTRDYDQPDDLDKVRKTRKEEGWLIVQKTIEEYLINLPVGRYSLETDGDMTKVTWPCAP